MRGGSVQGPLGGAYRSYLSAVVKIDSGHTCCCLSSLPTTVSPLDILIHMQNVTDKVSKGPSPEVLKL